MSAQTIETIKAPIIPIHSNNKNLRWWEDSEKVKYVKDQICKNATDNEFFLFLHICQRCGLDPLTNQIYFIKYGTKAANVTGIDGFRLIAERTGNYSPGREATFTYDKDGNIISASAYVKKRTSDGTWHEISASAHFEEYCKVSSGKRVGHWGTMPHVMIAKCAESLALRKAFPADLSGLYTRDEMEQAEVTITSNCSEKEEEKLVEIEFEIPEGIDAKKVDEYFDTLAKQYSKTTEYWKKRAIENPEGFWKMFNTWVGDKK